jgi:uncharacterized protein with PIN domain
MAHQGKSSSQAMTELSDLTQQVVALHEDLTQARLILQALCALLKEKSGISNDDLVETMSAIEKDLAENPREADKCPSCSRPLQARSKACIYCGALVTNRRLF